MSPDIKSLNRLDTMLRQLYQGLFEALIPCNSQELGLESLQNSRKLRRLSLFYKVYNDQSPLQLYNLIPAKTPGNHYPLRKIKEIPIIKVKHRFFENSFSPATIIEQNDLDYSLRNAPSINVFKQNILKLIRKQILTYTTSMI